MQRNEDLLATKINDLIKKGILIDKSQEEEYLKRNQIKLTRYQNGSRHIGLLAKRDDIRSASINLNFTVGSNKDPKRKAGLTHLLEHLFFNEKFKEFFNINQSWCNASTYSDLVTFAFGGHANHKYPDFSVPTVIEKAFSITRNLHGLENISNFEKTKQTIENEIENYEANFDRVTMDEFKKLIYSSDSDQVVNILGNKSTLKNISIDDINNFFSKYFTAENIVTSTFVEGEEEELELITGKINDSMLALKTGQNKIIPAYQIMNNHFKTSFLFNESKIDKKNLDLKNKLVNTFAYIKIDVPKHTVYEKALVVIGFILSEKLFQLSRVEGLSYRISSDYFHTMQDECVIFINSIDGNIDWDSKFNKFRDFIEKFTSEINGFEHLFKNELEMEIIRQKATPISRINMLNATKSSLINYDLISDLEVNRQLFLDITLDHIKEILEKIKNTKPNYFCVGDFK